MTALIVLNAPGLATARRVAAALPGARVHGLAGRVEGADESFSETAPALRALFGAGHPLVAFCAAGIVVRSLASVLGDKAAEPPVVAVAADGSAVVPLLGGLTGGEDLARAVGHALGVRPATTMLGALRGGGLLTSPRRGEVDAASAAAGEGVPADQEGFDAASPMRLPPHPDLRSDLSPSGRGRRSARQGSVTVLGLGPGDPGWLTPEAKAALEGATDLVGYGTYLDLAPPPRPGQRRHASDNREEIARAREALALAREGRAVALVSSGDPGIFAMAAALLEALEAEPELGAGIEVAVAPGLSAMQAAAARVGAPLGHDFAAISLSDNLKPWAVVERRLMAAAEADLVLALYNPAGRERREGLERAVALLRGAKAPETIVVAARDVGRPAERIAVTTLGALDTPSVDMRTLLIVGSSRTRLFSLADGRRFVYTPRHYP